MYTFNDLTPKKTANVDKVYRELKRMRKFSEEELGKHNNGSVFRNTEDGDWHWI